MVVNSGNSVTAIHAQDGLASCIELQAHDQFQSSSSVLRHPILFIFDAAFSEYFDSAAVIGTLFYSGLKYYLSPSAVSVPHLLEPPLKSLEKCLSDTAHYPSCITDSISAYSTARQTLMWLFCLSLPTRLLIPVRDQRPKRFQRQTDPHMIHITHHDWQTVKGHRAPKPG